MGRRDSYSSHLRDDESDRRERRRRSRSRGSSRRRHSRRSDRSVSPVRDGRNKDNRRRRSSDTSRSSDSVRHSRGRRSRSHDRHRRRSERRSSDRGPTKESSRGSLHKSNYSKPKDTLNNNESLEGNDIQISASIIQSNDSTNSKHASGSVSNAVLGEQVVPKDKAKLDRLARFKKLAEEKKLNSAKSSTEVSHKTVSLKIEPAKTKKVVLNALGSFFQASAEPQSTEKPEVETDTNGVDPLDFYMETIMKESEEQLNQVQLSPIIDTTEAIPAETGKSVTLEDIMAMQAECEPPDEADEEAFLAKLMRKTTKDHRKQRGDDDVISSDDEKKEESRTMDYSELLNKQNARSRIEMPKVDHSTINYQPFKKNFYVQVSAITAMKEHEVDAFRKANGNIRVRGKYCPRPISNFSQCGLPDPILGLLQHRNYEKPFPIQMQCIPALMCGRDVLAIAETGSGKTLAYLLPAMRHVMDQPKLRENDGMIALIIAPTRELASQIGSESSKISKLIGLRTKTVYGGSPIGEQLNALKRGAEIVCGTPGRLIEVLTISNGKVTNLRRVTFVVIDEADRMFDMGFSPQISAIIGNVRPDRQTALFSATFPPTIEALAKKILTKPLQVVVGKPGKSASQVDQHVLVLTENQKMFMLLKLLGEWHEHGSIIIFVNRQVDADNMFTELLKHGYECAVLHGGQDQTDREFTLQDFRDGTKGILIATSIAARGIDVVSVVLVVNYATPDHIEDYVHRVGRTGRAGNIGTSYTFITPDEAIKSHDIIKALKASNQEVPVDLQNLANAHLATLDGKHKVRLGGGFGGRGFKFTDSEKSRQQQERQYACIALGFNTDLDEEEEAALADNATGGLGGLKAGTTTGQPSSASTSAKETANPFDKSAVVKEPEPMIKGLTCAGYIDANTGYTHDEFGINSYAEAVRMKVTNKEVLSYVMEQTGVTLQVKGRYIPVDMATKSLNMIGGTKGLYIEIVGPSVVSVQAALSELRKIVQAAAVTPLSQPVPQKVPGRYSVL